MFLWDQISELLVINKNTDQRIDDTKRASDTKRFLENKKENTKIVSLRS